MREFKHPNTSNKWKCTICGTNDDKPVVLVEVIGTKDGYNVEAEQIHADCINLVYDKEYKILYQRLD